MRSTQSSLSQDGYGSFEKTAPFRISLTKSFDYFTDQIARSYFMPRRRDIPTHLKNHHQFTRYRGHLRLLSLQSRNLHRELFDLLVRNGIYALDGKVPPSTLFRAAALHPSVQLAYDVHGYGQRGRTAEADKVRT